MFIVVIWEYCGLPWKIGRPEKISIANFWTQFPNPGFDTGPESSDCSLVLFNFQDWNPHFFVLTAAKLYYTEETSGQQNDDDDEEESPDIPQLEVGLVKVSYHK